MNFALDAYLDELRPLIDVDCGTLTVSGIETVAGILTEKYQQLGWNIKQVDLGEAGCGLEVRNKPDAEQIDLMMVGHMDTVFPEGTVAERPMTFDDKCAYGPGVSDMKSGLLNVIYALRAIDEDVLDKLSICVCMNPDEEIGSTYSHGWLESVASEAKQVLVAEAARADGSLVKARKGMARYDIEFHGKAAHAGNEPENGRSAITEMAHWLLAINELTNFETGTTFNNGVVSGGAGANIVPDYAKIVVDIRFWDNREYEAMDEKLKSMTETPFTKDITVSISRAAHKPAMVPSDKTVNLMSVVEESGNELGIEINWKEVGGGSDANLTAAMGIPTLDGLGPIGGGFHSSDEYLDLSSIEPRINLLKTVICKLANA
ncbi:peptidase M20 [Endozoicomonas sp. OPT23]|uniref:M20 family metallopeptidase n=1 Tax=Endozoicomonas sp. OPT23 TaxID=2072845 RepID=UPI00129ABC97|nr:M20 family metallopeptidase [Endozoicomonas sp. OPT23]MRI32873.1 peptidase M20 [Endozoicomonas sp. OPT23]